jgi:predicted RNase H-like nuclease (RuvC/YqgF family)
MEQITINPSEWKTILSFIKGKNIYRQHIYKLIWSGKIDYLKIDNVYFIHEKTKL